MQSSIYVQCPKCAKEFNQVSNLLQHFKMIHEDKERNIVKKYNCGKCMKEFICAKQNFERHSKICEGPDHDEIFEKNVSHNISFEKDVNFNLQSKEAMQDQNRKSNSDPFFFECIECGKEFTQKSYLIPHLK